MGSDPLRHHTWSGITDSGYFTNHDVRGDTLYGADVYVHPEARGKGWEPLSMKLGGDCAAG